MGNYLIVTSCPAPAKLAPILEKIRQECGCTYASIYRGTDARALLEANGKHDQAWLYANLPPGVANPPGRSTHELKNDGVAYTGWVGMPLQWWQCGLDVDDAHVQAFITTARKHGWIATITYPGSAVEYHHINFRRLPKFNVFPTLKVGKRGPRVKVLTHRLGLAGYLSHSGFFFSKHVGEVVKKFQRDHHLVADGIVGPSTWKQILVSARRHKKGKK